MSYYKELCELRNDESKRHYTVVKDLRIRYKDNEISEDEYKNSYDIESKRHKKFDADLVIKLKELSNEQLLQLAECMPDDPYKSIPGYEHRICVLISSVLEDRGL